MPAHYVHRGLIKRNLVENTIKSFKNSIKRGYGIETDLHITKDKQIVCFHDFNLKHKFKRLNNNIKHRYKKYRVLKNQINNRLKV